MREEAVHIEARVVEFLRTRGLLRPGTPGTTGTHYLVAASGGRDSTVLSQVMANIAAAWNARLTLATVHHGLRPEADEEVRFVKTFADRLGAGFLQRRVDVRSELLGTGGTVQDAARKLRYAALEGMCDEAGAETILTAHHADDQAETLLAHFLRGAGPEGLSGIRPVRGRIARPLLSVSSADIAAYAEKEGVTWMDDASNARDEYRRNAIRHHVSPAITRVFGTGWVRALGNSARLHEMLAAHIEAVSDDLARETIMEDGESVLVRGISLNDSSEFEKLTVCRRAIRWATGSEPSLDECLTLLGLLAATPGARSQLHNGFLAMREQDGLRLYHSPAPHDAIECTPGMTVSWGAWTLAVTEPISERPAFVADSHEEVIDLDATGGEWQLREWTPDDRFTPFGFGREKGVGDFLADSGYAIERRRRIPVLVGNQGIIWVCGVRLAQHAALRETSQRFCRLRFFITESMEA